MCPRVLTVIDICPCVLPVIAICPRVSCESNPQ
jgi:hypothetical protein